MSLDLKAVEASIRSEIASIKKEAVKRLAGQDKPEWEPEMDSQNVLRVCLRIEEETGLVISEEVVPPGGFNDVEQCVQALLTETAKAWDAQSAKEKIA